MNHIRNERGQAIVLIALAMVAVLGFAALAVDGGRVLAEKRRAQNAANSAAYAAASAAIDSGDWEQAGLDQASFNAFTDADAANNPGQDLDVMVYNPPVDGPYAPGNISADLDPNQFYQAKIRNKVDQVFSQVVYPNGLEISAEAVAYARPSGSLSAGDAIVALTPHGCQGIKMHGDGKVTIRGGNINSKSDADPPPTSCNSLSLEGGGSPDYNLVIEDGNVISAGSQDLPTGEYLITGGTTLEYHTTSPIPTLPDPDCSHLTTRSYSGGDATLYPGIYPNGIKVNNNEVVKLMPGMYCLDGGSNGGLRSQLNNDGSLTGDRVFIVIRQGSVKLEGQGTIELNKAKSIFDGAGRQWGGMLFFMPYSNTGEIHMSGGAETFYRGTIYAPGPRSPESQYKCNIEGNSSLIGVNSSIFCYSITVGGASDVSIDFNENQNYRLAPSIELTQ